MDYKKGIVLIGMPGVGKSTIGELLAKQLGYDFVDVDIELQKRYNHKSPQEIIETFGVQTFLQFEKQMMYELSLENKVIAPGGSIVYHHDLMVYLSQYVFRVYLDDTFENIEARIKNKEQCGIIGLKTKSFREIFEERQPLYLKYADVIISCKDKNKEEIIKLIINYL